MSQSTDESTLRSLRQEHRELVAALKVKKGIEASIIALPTTNKSSNIAWLRKAIKGLKAQLDTKHTTKKAPKPSGSTRKGKFTKKQAEQYVKSFHENYDDDNIKDLEDLRNRSKNKGILRKIKEYDEEKELAEWLIKEFNI